MDSCKKCGSERISWMFFPSEDTKMAKCLKCGYNEKQSVNFGADSFYMNCPENSNEKNDDNSQS
ncbi:MAG: hypothetical protein ACLFQK_00160 [Fibrobacterota bacterium]